MILTSVSLLIICLDLMVKEAAPNDKNLYYEDFKFGMLYECNKEESEFIELFSIIIINSKLKL